LIPALLPRKRGRGSLVWIDDLVTIRFFSAPLLGSPLLRRDRADQMTSIAKERCR
jgi:hypothetical protein